MPHGEGVIGHLGKRESEKGNGRMNTGWCCEIWGRLKERELFSEQEVGRKQEGSQHSLF